MRFNAIPSAVVSASANTVGGVPVGNEDDAATADVVVVKLKQALSPAKIQYNLNGFLFTDYIIYRFNWIRQSNIHKEFISFSFVHISRKLPNV